MKIFNYEKEAGLSDFILANRSIAFEVDINPSVEKLVQTDFAKAIANPNQPDLFYIESVLVSTGWNSNDDVFDRKELWAARYSPVDKQFNFMHNEADIIGHITSTKVVADNKVILKEEDLPEQFDILVGSVLYRHWRDEKLQERMDQIIADIHNHKWFISMECLFDDFDYAIITPTNEKKIIARTNETAFLSKYLRVYKGTGIYQGHKVGRLPRNITFCGKGLVDNPANKRSVIYSYSDFSDVGNDFIAAMENKNMSGVTYTQEQYTEVSDKLIEANAFVEASKVKIAALESDKAALATEVQELQSKVDGAKQLEVSLASVTEEKKTLEQTINEQIAALAQFKAEKAKAERLSMLANVNMPETDKVSFVDKFVALSDEMFKTVVDTLPVKPQTSVATKVEFKKVDLEKKVEPNLAVATDKGSDMQTGVSNWLKASISKPKK